MISKQNKLYFYSIEETKKEYKFLTTYQFSS